MQRSSQSAFKKLPRKTLLCVKVRALLSRFTRSRYKFQFAPLREEEKDQDEDTDAVSSENQAETRVATRRRLYLLALRKSDALKHICPGFTSVPPRKARERLSILD